MRFKRNEAFRYQFGQPLLGTFRIAYIDGKEMDSEKGAVEIYDISPKGMKIRTVFDIPPRPRDVCIQVTFILNDVEFNLLGIIVWQKRDFRGYFYGLQLHLSHEQEEIMIRELKRYVTLRQSD
ncbi:hypothetical protein B6A27_09560 [Anoxybacillus sp. UARK-01]|uniref:PilZ domain-containing protein n=1 Tax=Anoxybacillus sp. UARK-01 TaxID=1895648 RepID=UPI0009B9DF9B|nr:PilZ domain-containing protein [Anoxybacillus sp. UARK-01]OQM45887.1 hypothetical protein B6A27_09560 [Anoxybacillus sp. UARK-01]